uniref:hypothetical protein n=1 Tax=uncultured Erythrobacter sp. TaxID=263913 RepID=UPI0026280E26|nr:hypothetical protein [uncultured Erythrobacter sp.]
MNFKAIALALGSLSLFAPQPASANDTADWKVAFRSEMCALEHYPDPEGGLLFALSMGMDGLYSMSGIVFGEYTEPDGALDRVEIEAGDKKLLLLGPASELSAAARQRENEHPVVEFLSITDGQSEFTVIVDGKAHIISSATLSDVHAEFGDCVSANLAPKGPRPPIVTAFDGVHALGREAARQRLLSQNLDFTLSVDANGKPTECDLAYDFRRKATEIAICRPLLKYMKFEPAIDENGDPVAGTYKSTIDFNLWMTQRGYLEPRFR